MVYQGFTRVCVPIFFMISGATLIPKLESGRSLAKRIVTRIVFPYLFWSIIYISYSAAPGATCALSSLITTPPYYHLDFLFNLITLYLSLPLIRGFWNNPETTRATKKYTIGASLLGGIITQFLPPFFGQPILGFGITCLPYYCGFAMLGAYLADTHIDAVNGAAAQSLPARRHIVVTSFVLYAMFSLLSALFTVRIAEANSNIPISLFFEYSAPFVVGAAVCFFMMAIHLGIPAKLCRVLKEISACTLFIYLAHPLVLDLLQKGRLGLTVQWNTGHPLWFMPVFAVAVVLLCGIPAWCARACFIMIKRVILAGRNYNV